jgi:putative adenylate-forming enzyme
MVKKIRILKHFLSTKHFTDPITLQKYQEQKLQKLFSGLKGSFYPRSHQLSDFPIINKKIFMENFDAINQVGISYDYALKTALDAEACRDFSPKIDGITVGLSSGTSGSRGLFLVSDEESSQWAGYILRRMLPKPYWQQHKIAFFLRANSNLYESVTSSLVSFSFFDLQIPLQEHIGTLNTLQPTLLIAPAQVLRLLAQTPHLTIAPKKIISVAEVLEAEDKARIEQRFGVIVHQVYQCTEGFLAHTCEHGTLHLNEDLVVIEKKWIDVAQRRFSPIITDFNRTTQPIIRYQLDDILVASDSKCPCGSVFTPIEKIEGRCDDILTMRSLEGEMYLLFPDFIRRAIITCDAPIHEYQVIQKGDTLEIFIDPFSSWQGVDEALHMLYHTHGIVPLHHRFYPWSPLPLKQKRRRVYQQ